MKDEVLTQIIQNAQENSVIPISSIEIEEMIQRTEAKLGKPLSGYVREDKPYTQFYSKEAIERVTPKKKIASLVMESLENNGEDIAIECGRTITREELRKNVLIAAESLIRHGIKKGDIITICSPSTPELVYYFLAANLIGAITRPIDPISSKATTRANLEATKSKLLITLDLNYKNFKGITDNLDCKVIGLSISDTFPYGINFKKYGIKLLGKITESSISKDRDWITHKDFIKESLEHKIELSDVESTYNENDIYCIYSSSGTSGMPKGISSLDSSMIASVMKQIDANYKRVPGDKIFNPMPSYSTYFWNDIYYALLSNIPVTLCPLFSVDKSIEQILDSGCSIILLGPIICERLNKYVERMEKRGKKVDLSHIHHMFSGGDILRVLLEEQTNETLRKCNSTAKVENAYGTSEDEGPAFIPNGATQNPDAYSIGSVGTPMPGDDVVIFPYDSENDSRNIYEENYDLGLQYYQIGEICLKTTNPEVFAEYYHDPEATALAKITHTDGTEWYHTGDLGYMDPAGRMFCSGRKTGLIVRSGHKIWTSKINSVVRKHEEIIDCETIGLDDNQEQEVPVLFIVFNPEVSEEEKSRILGQLNFELEREYDALHIPKYVRILDKIPRNLLLKSKLQELKKLALEEKEKAEIKEKEQKTSKVHKLVRRVRKN